MNFLRLPAAAWTFAVLLAFSGFPVSLAAQTASPANAEMDPHRLWTFSTDEQKAEEDLNRTEGRIVQQETFARLGFDGHYLPYLEIENRSLKVDSTTMRTTERTYSIDPENHKALTQVLREDTQVLGDGTVKTVRVNSMPNAAGRLIMTRRETEDSRQTRPAVRESETTIFTAPRSGGVATMNRVDRRETRRDDHTVEFHESVLLPDGKGGWQTSEVHDGLIRDDGSTHTKEERILQPDAGGKLAVVERVITRDSAAAAGQQRQTVETYAAEAGVPGENNLQLQRRVTTTRWPRADGSEFVEEQVEERNSASPAEGLQLTRKKTDILIPGVGSAGRLGDSVDYSANPIISIDTRKNSDAAVQVDTSGSH